MNDEEFDEQLDRFEERLRQRLAKLDKRLEELDHVVEMLCDQIAELKENQYPKCEDFRPLTSFVERDFREPDPGELTF